MYKTKSIPNQFGWIRTKPYISWGKNVILFQNKIPGLVSLVSVYWGLSSAYPVTFDNDDKSDQNKSHHEITVQLCGIIFRAKVKYTGSILPWVRMIGLLFQIFFCIYLLLNYIEIYQNTFKMHLCIRRVVCVVSIMLRDKYLYLYMCLYGISRGITVYLISYFVYLYMLKYTLLVK